MDTVTDKKTIEKFLNRSVADIYPEKKLLKERMMSGDTLRVYAGIDPTADRVHLGHVINYLILKRFRRLGHKVIVLVGDFTARIGDPSDKDEVRSQLSEEEIESNLNNFKEQIGKIIDLSADENPVEFRYNSEWLSDMNFSDVIDLASNFTVQQMIERDVFQRRLDDEKPLYVHEFFYPLMQGYDTVALDADIEVGGTDQTFNMLAGRTLRKRIEDKEKFVITHPLLEDPDSGKMLMSKSEGRGVFLDAEPEEVFARVMKIPDSGIIQFFTHCTERSMEDIKVFEDKLESGANPRDIKLELAHEIVSLVYSADEADTAQETFVDTFSNQQTPEDTEEINANTGDRLMDILAGADVVPSKSQFRRLVDQGAITNLETDEKIDDHTYEVEDTATFKVGKHRFIKISVE
jgi:tyrosyl-tRNA synthetase